MSLLVASQLRKNFGSTLAVDDLSLEVGSSEVLGLLGPNGAGKTTTMLMLAGLLAPDSGTVQLQGQAVSSTDRRLRASIGLVPQELAIYPDLTARENLRFFGQLYGLAGQLLRQRTDDALDATGLAKHAKQLTRTFSGGMKRRLNFAVALLHKPSLLILDEPTVGVDPQSRAHLLECIRHLRNSGTGVIYASHYMEEVQALCDRVVIIDDGRLIACGRIDELLGKLDADLVLQVSDSADDVVSRLRQLESIDAEIAAADHETITSSNQTIVIRNVSHGDLRQRLGQIMDLLSESEIGLTSIQTRDANLEQLFLELTGHGLRD